MISRLITRWILAILMFVFLLPSNTYASIEDWYRGANIMPQTNTDFGSENMFRSLDDLKSTGASIVSFIVPYYQADTNSTIINRGGNTPTDESLVSAINYAHSIGLDVTLKMHVETHNHEWRANINPSDRSAWFSSYNNILLHYATLSQTHGVEQIIIGTELIKMSSHTFDPTNTTNWENMITNIRGVYSGTLTYGANWGDGNWTEEAPQIQFWDKLDYIGISSYYWLAPNSSGVATVEDLSATWEDWNNRKLKPLYTQWNKPIIFTEVGYRSIEGAHNHPWNWWDSGTYSEEEQANDYAALFSYWNDHSYMKGVYLWSWEINPQPSGSNEKGYSPQNKLAESVMTDWFTNQPANTGSTSFDVNGNDIQTEVGVEKNIVVEVQNTGTNAGNVLVNIEIHSPQYQKIHQEFFSSQLVGAGESKSFTTNWTPQVDGTYTVMVGIFKNDWSENYLWKSDVAEIIVGEATQTPTNPPTTPPPTNTGTQIDIWWPSNGANVSGTQPFKAMMPDNSLENYKMYWQVDGGGLNIMSDSDVDYPHKEAWVDLTNWRWKNDNTYNINFVTYDLSDEMLSSKDVDIVVSH